ncbi:class I SAM-dependent methyltransferase [Actinomadura fulvescens]|uniref:Class I SAM-dependent methyltransferase n=1 Tax=Actinomadura fulvescens TaxID=46160 RepID=A0ABP6CF91_9ACTN
MGELGGELGGHPDRLRWNAKYAKYAKNAKNAEKQDGAGGSFRAHPVAEAALALSPPEGPVLDLACGPSGSALLAASNGRRVTAVDVSEVALDLLDREARRRGVRELLTLVHADLGTWRAEEPFAVVLCTGFWDRAVFEGVVDAVAPGGALGWEAFTLDARAERPRLPARWCLEAGQPASLLPRDFAVVLQEDVAGGKRRTLARRT